MWMWKSFCGYFNTGEGVTCVDVDMKSVFGSPNGEGSERMCLCGYGKVFVALPEEGKVGDGLMSVYVCGKTFSTPPVGSGEDSRVCVVM